MRKKQTVPVHYYDSGVLNINVDIDYYIGKAAARFMAIEFDKNTASIVLKNPEIPIVYGHGCYDTLREGGLTDSQIKAAFNQLNKKKFFKTFETCIEEGVSEFYGIPYRQQTYEITFNLDTLQKYYDLENI